MRARKDWSDCRTMGPVRSVAEAIAAREARIDTEPLQDAVRPQAAGLQPDFIEPQDVPVGMDVGHLADVVQRIDEALELGRELAKDAREDGRARGRPEAGGERPIGRT